MSPWQKAPEHGSSRPSFPAARLPTWNAALSEKAQEGSQVLTHLPDVRCCGQDAWGPCGGLAGTELHGAAGKGQAFWPEGCGPAGRLVPPLLTPSFSLRVSAGGCLLHVATWVATDFLESPQDVVPPAQPCVHSP